MINVNKKQGVMRAISELMEVAGLERGLWVDPTRLSPRTEYVEVLDEVRGGATNG